MSAPREELFVALFAKIEGLVAPVGADLSVAAPLRIASRSLRSWDDTPAGECPAAFLIADSESRTTTRGFPSLIRIDAEIVVYAKNMDGRDTVPSTQLNALISALEDALRRTTAEGPAPTAMFPMIQAWGTTLGGLCYTCAIGDRIEIFEGFQGADSCALIPVYMLTTDRA